MSKKDMVFKGYFMTDDMEPLVKSKFIQSLRDAMYDYSYTQSNYKVYPTFEGELLYLYCTHGSVFPRPDTVINTDTNAHEVNPRKTNQYEPKQSFAIIDFLTGSLWLSSERMKSFVWTFLIEKTSSPNLAIKELFSEAEFIKTLNRVDSIRFSAAPDLFNTTHTLSSEFVKDINGYEAPVAIIHFKYQDKFVGSTLQQKISTLIKAKEYMRSIMISGKDANNVGMVFNSDMISKKLSIRTKLRDNGTFDENDVFDKLKQKLNQ